MKRRVWIAFVVSVLAPLFPGGCSTSRNPPTQTASVAPTSTPLPTQTSTPCPGSASFVVAGGDSGGAASGSSYGAVVDGCGIVSWAPSSPVPAGLESSLPAAAEDPGGFLVLAGGFSNGSLAAPISSVAVGTLAGAGFSAWAQASPIPVGLGGAAAAIGGGFLYVTGGQSSTSVAVSSVYFSAVISPGQYGAFASVTAPMAQRVFGHAAFVAGGYLYVLGGRDPYNANRAEVYSAQIQGSGDLLAWTSTTPLPVVWSLGACVIDGGFVTIIGGRPAANTTMAWSAPILAGGLVGSWSSQSGIPAPGASFASAARATVAGTTYLFSVGGWDGGAGAYSTVYRSTLSVGVLSGWTRVADFPVPINDEVCAPAR